MNSRIVRRLDDILDATRAIESYLSVHSMDDGMVFDAVRIRLIEIGEAVKALPESVLARPFWPGAIDLSGSDYVEGAAGHS